MVEENGPSTGKTGQRYPLQVPILTSDDGPRIVITSPLFFLDIPHYYVLLAAMSARDKCKQES